MPIYPEPWLIWPKPSENAPMAKLRPFHLIEALGLTFIAIDIAVVALLALLLWKA